MQKHTQHKARAERHDTQQKQKTSHHHARRLHVAVIKKKKKFKLHRESIKATRNEPGPAAILSAIAAAAPNDTAADAAASAARVWPPGPGRSLEGCMSAYFF